MWLPCNHCVCIVLNLVYSIYLPRADGGLDHGLDLERLFGYMYRYPGTLLVFYIYLVLYPDTLD